MLLSANALQDEFIKAGRKKNVYHPNVKIWQAVCLAICRLPHEMKKFYALLIVLLAGLGARAQDSSEVQPAYTCDDMTYTYTNLMTYYYGKYDDDSLKMVMADWEQTCGLSEPLVSFKALYAIEKGNYDERIYGDSMVSFLVQYEANANKISDWPPNVPDDYYKYLRSIAKALQKLTLTPEEKVLVDFYAEQDDAVLSDMDTTLAGTRLYKDFKAYEEEKYKYFGKFHISVLAGVWSPEGHIAAFGNKPMLGLQIGSIWKNRVTADVHVSFRFIRSPKPIDVNYFGDLYSTSYYTAVYAGLDMGYRFAEFGKKSKVFVLGGLGYDATTVVQSSSDEANDGKYLSSLNINGGLGYRYYINKHNYIGLMGKYNLLFYNNPNGTDLSGNAYTITLVYGFH
jgi:hypothetical protein